MKKILLAAALASLAAPAMAADLPTRKGPPPAPMVYAAPAFTWTGFYLGLNGGFNYTNFGPNFGSTWGGVLGGTAGYNQQIGQFVVGLETDYGFSNAGVHGASAFGPTEAHINDIFTVARPRRLCDGPHVALRDGRLFRRQHPANRPIRCRPPRRCGRAAWRSAAASNTPSPTTSPPSSKTSTPGTATPPISAAPSSRSAIANPAILLRAGVNYKF